MQHSASHVATTALLPKWPQKLSQKLEHKCINYHRRKKKSRCDERMRANTCVNKSLVQALETCPFTDVTPPANAYGQPPKISCGSIPPDPPSLRCFFDQTPRLLFISLLILCGYNSRVAFISFESLVTSTTDKVRTNKTVKVARHCQ